MVPTFTCFRSTREVPSFTPMTPRGYATDLPRGLPTIYNLMMGGRYTYQSVHAHHRPAHIRQVGAGST